MIQNLVIMEMGEKQAEAAKKKQEEEDLPPFLVDFFKQVLKFGNFRKSSDDLKKEISEIQIDFMNEMNPLLFKIANKNQFPVVN